MKNNLTLNQSGQTLVEVIIALGVLVVVIVGFTNIILTSLQNSQYARHQETATQYARNAIESIRVMRDQSTAIFTNPSGTSSIQWEELWNANSISGHLSNPNNCYALEENFPSFEMFKVDCSQPIPIPEDNLYQRTIQLGCYQRAAGDQTCSSGSGDVSIISTNVTVIWIDSKGTHSAELSSNLSRW